MIVKILFRERNTPGVFELKACAPTIEFAKRAFRNSYPSRSIINAVRVG